MLRIGSTSTNSSTSKAINIRNDNERIGILKDPDGKYSLDISGSINCNALLVDGSIMNNFSPVWLTNDSDDNIYYSEGNVGIGTTSSIEKLHVVGNIKLTGSLVTSTTTLTNTELNYLSGVTSNIQTQIDAAAASGVWVTTGNNIYYNTGNVGIGTTTPHEKLSVYGTVMSLGENAFVIERKHDTFNDANTPRRWTIGMDSGTDATASPFPRVLDTFHLTYYQGSSYTRPLIINTAGKVGIGNTNPTHTLDVNGSISASSDIYIGGSSGVRLSGTTNALTVNGTTTSTNFIATSDIRLKENIEKIENPLDKILKLSGYNYNFIKDDSKEKKAGLIAQHVEEYIPEAVHTKDETKSLDYNGIIPYLVECIKLQNHKINELENKIENLINT